MAEQSHRSGFTLFELVFTIGLISVLLGVAVVNLRGLNGAADSGAAEVVGFLKQVRARAMASTSAYKVAPSSSGQLVVTYGNVCSAATTTDGALILKLPTGATFNSTSWNVCFNSRGFPDQSPSIALQDTNGVNKTVQIYLGGAIRSL
jgi:prepilin-type N-terminal cleavage/methylation domain-containing protein